MADKKRKIEFEITAKDAGFKAQLEQGKKVAQDVEKSAKSATASLKDMAVAVGAAFAGSKMLGFFKGAVVEANKLEKTMLGLEATARLAGQSFEKLKSSVTKLSSDGVMSIDQASTSMKTLIAQGMQADKAFELLDAAKKVSSFNNIVGDAGQGVQDFVKFLQTGSAELAENMDPSIIKTVKSLGGYVKVSTDAVAKQKLINAVIEKGGKLASDYDKFLNSGAQAQVRFDGATLALSQTLGQKLQPAFTAILNGVTKIVTWLTELINSMDSVTVATVAMGATGFVAIASFSKAAALLPGVFGSIGASIAGALGPIGLFIAGVSAAVIVIGKLRREFGTSKTRDLLNERDALIQQIGAMQNLAGKTKELNDAKAKLLDLNKQIVANYAQYLKYLDAENLSIEKKISLVDALEKAEKRLSIDKDLKDRSADELAAKSKELEGEYAKGAKALASGKISRARYDEELGKVSAEKALIDAALEAKVGASSGPVKVGGTAIQGNEARFIETQRQIQEIERNRIYTMAKLEGDLAREGFVKGTAQYSQELQRRRDMARSDANLQVAQEKEKLRQVFAEYIEDETMMRQAALQQQTQNALRASQEQLELELGQAGQNEALIQDAKEANEKRIQKIRETNARKSAEIAAQSMATTLQAANAMTAGLAQALKARDIGSALSGQGGFLTGLSQLSPALSALGPMGGAVGAAGGIISTFTSLFGKSDEQRAREAEEQKRRDDEAKAILELQANYQKNMLALQEAAAKLPFEDLTRTLRLIDVETASARISGGDQASLESQRLQRRQAAMQATLSQESGTIGGGELFTGFQATPQSLISFLSERAAQQTAIAQFMGLINQLATDGGLSQGMLYAIYAQAKTYSGKIPQEIYSAGIDGLQKFAEHMALPTSQRTNEQYEDFFSALVGAPSRVAALTSEVTRDTSTAENLLSVIEQSQQTQLEIAANTKKTADALTLQGAREQRFIDIAGGGLRGFGQFMAGNIGVNTGAMTLPSGVSNTILATQQAKSIDEQMNAKLGDLVTIARDQARFLGEIALNTSRMAGANVTGSPSEFEVLERLKAYEARS